MSDDIEAEARLRSQALLLLKDQAPTALGGTMDWHVAIAFILIRLANED